MTDSTKDREQTNITGLRRANCSQATREQLASVVPSWGSGMQALGGRAGREGGPSRQVDGGGLGLSGGGGLLSGRSNSQDQEPPLTP